MSKTSSTRPRKSANEFCLDNGMEFKILTEDHLNPGANSNMAQSKFIQSMKLQKVDKSTEWYRKNKRVWWFAMDLIVMVKETMNHFLVD